VRGARGSPDARTLSTAESRMNYAKKIDYAERLAAQKEARAALVAKMKPKPAASNSDLAEREARKEAERQAIRAKRLEEREAARQARELAAAAAAEAAVRRNSPRLKPRSSSARSGRPIRSWTLRRAAPRVLPNTPSSPRIVARATRAKRARYRRDRLKTRPISPGVSWSNLNRITA
jgi:hypothetical protein